MTMEVEHFFMYLLAICTSSFENHLCISLSQVAKNLVPSYYCLYSLFNKIRDKGKIVFPGSEEVGGRGSGWSGW
jgi:hypothetical protein